MYEPQQVLGSMGGEDLPMASVVPQKGHLRECHCKKRRDDQLIPGLSHEPQSHPAGSEYAERAGDLDGVIADS